MTAKITKKGDGLIVECAQHPRLADVAVNSAEHAKNLKRSHDRKWHADEPQDKAAPKRKGPSSPAAETTEPISLAARRKAAERPWYDARAHAGFLLGALDAWCEFSSAPDRETGLAWAIACVESTHEEQSFVPPF